MAFVATTQYYQVLNAGIIGGPLNRPNHYGPNSQPPLGPEQDGSYYYQLWVDERGAAPGLYYSATIGDVTINEQEQRCERVDSWDAWTDEQIAADLDNKIQAQVPDATVKQRVIDPLIEADIGRYAGAASDKEIELQEAVEAGADLTTFDPTLDVTPPQNGKGYAQLAVNIVELEPWAGAPDDNLGFEAVLNISTEYEDQGAEARLWVIEAPSDTGAVLPFEQNPDPADSNKWSCKAREGHRWQDPELSCTIQLLWGAGSLPTSKKLKCKHQNDRQAALVRYSVPTTRAGRKKK